MVETRSLCVRAVLSHAADNGLEDARLIRIHRVTSAVVTYFVGAATLPRVRTPGLPRGRRRPAGDDAARRAASPPRSRAGAGHGLIVAAVLLRPRPDRPAHAPRRGELGDHLRRDHDPGDAVPRPRRRGERGDRGVRPAGHDREDAARAAGARGSRRRGGRRRAAGLRVRLGPGRGAGSSRSASRPAAAFAFLLSAPAINPVVLVATAVAFPGQPDDGARPGCWQPGRLRRDGHAVDRRSAATTC